MITSPYNVPRITPPSEHPRLMLRRGDIDRISRADRNSTAWKQFRELCEFPILGVGANPEKGTYHLKEYLALEAKALESLIENDEKKGWQDGRKPWVGWQQSQMIIYMRQ